MMYLSLIRKDFDVLFRENIGIIIFQQLFILIIISLNLGIMGYGVMVTSFGWQLLMVVAAKDKENHSLALLVSMPYNKETIINARYLSTILGFVGVTTVYEVIAVVTNRMQISFLKLLDLQVVLLSLGAYFIFISITLPLYFRFEDSIVKGISILLILATTFIGVGIWERTNLRFVIASMPRLQEYYSIFFIAISIISLVVSRTITLNLFKKMEF